MISGDERSSRKRRWGTPGGLGRQVGDSGGCILYNGYLGKQVQKYLGNRVLAGSGKAKRLIEGTKRVGSMVGAGRQNTGAR